MHDRGVEDELTIGNLISIVKKDAFGRVFGLFFSIEYSPFSFVAAIGAYCTSNAKNQKPLEGWDLPYSIKTGPMLTAPTTGSPVTHRADAYHST